MAFSKALVFFVLISFLVLHLVQAHEMVNNFGSEAYMKKMDCGAACAARCRLASRHKMCLRACGTCCARCNCVPPGTSGNQKLCPCYYLMTTHGGRRKCP
uniref:Gibberellin regulated protein n=1 Tax=Opuntia streptacantha TaxID=393608 RepID=A0A7C9CW40_OPUST